MKKDFIEYIKNEFAFSDLEIKEFEKALKMPLKKTIRVNTNKISIDDFKKIAKKNNWTLTKTLLWKNIFYIDRENAKEIALWNTIEHIWWYFYIQELSASSSPFYMSWDKIDKNEYLILDMSASPWWKTTELSEYYPNSLIVANELDKQRLKWFFSNLDRMSSLNVVATNYDGRFFKQIPELFDKVLIDAPCSWEWTAFKTDDALKYWNLKNIKTISKLQFWLLESAIKTCKVWWEIVYSTCTLNKIENEWVIEKILKKYNNQIEILPLWDKNSFKRNWPHLSFSGWFFVAKIKKIASLNQKNFQTKQIRQNIEKVSNTDLKKIKEFFENNFSFDISNYYVYSYKWEIQITNKSLNKIWDKLFLYKIWVNIWNIKDWEFIPNFYAWTFEKFQKNIIELDKKQIDQLLAWYEIDLDLKDWYYQIISNSILIWIAKQKNKKLKSLIPTKLLRNTK